jgi:heme/copper-type cytochrome/quinol oxidase subunit 2
MPVVVKVVTKAEYAAWLAAQKAPAQSADAAEPQVDTTMPATAASPSTEPAPAG